MSTPLAGRDWQDIERILLGSQAHVFEARTAGNVRCAVTYFYQPVQLGQQVETDSASDEHQAWPDDKLEKMRDNIAGLIHLSHENLLPILDVKLLPQEAAVAMFIELVSGPSLAQVIRNRDSAGGGLPEVEIRSNSKQICSALEYLHSEENNIVHRNLDSENVIVVREGGGLVKLINFGMSVHLTEGVSCQVTNCPRGRPHYMAPELFQMDTDESRYSRGSDIWALGCLVYEMAAGLKPYEANCRSISAIANSVTKNGAPDLPQPCSPALRSFYGACTFKERHHRSSASRLLQHPFLA